MDLYPWCFRRANRKRIMRLWSSINLLKNHVFSLPKVTDPNFGPDSRYRGALFESWKKNLSKIHRRKSHLISVVNLTKANFKGKFLLKSSQKKSLKNKSRFHCEWSKWWPHCFKDLKIQLWEVFENQNNFEKMFFLDARVNFSLRNH